MTGTAVRAFIAIDVPEQVKASLDATLRELRATLSGRAYGWVRVEGIHLTLKFLGDVDEDSIPTISDALAPTASGERPFSLRLRGTGTFPPGRRPNVVWASLDGDLDALAEVQERVEEAMTRLGFEAERRTFQPHLTLGRIRSRLSDADLRTLTTVLAEVTHEATEPFTVEAVRLVRSEFRPGGARYTTLATAKLTG